MFPMDLLPPPPPPPPLHLSSCPGKRVLHAFATTILFQTKASWIFFFRELATRVFH
jgi:hypothetical protein